MTNLNELWSKFSNLVAKLLTKPFYLWDIRLSMLITLVEDQFLLMSLLTHLQLTFKVWYRKMYNTVGDDMQTFLNEFDGKFEANL